MESLQQPSVEQAAPGETQQEAPRAKPKAGTGVFFNAALASRLAGNRSGKQKQGPRASQSFSGISRSSAHGGAGRTAGSASGHESSRNVPSRRRASMDLPRSPTPPGATAAHMTVGRASSFTAASSSGQGVMFRSSGHSMPGGQEITLYQLLSSPQASNVSTVYGSPHAAAPQGTAMSPAQQMQLLQQQQQQLLQQQQQLIMEQEQEQQRINEIQKLQAQLQTLLQQQQARNGQAAIPQQPVQLINMVRSSTDGMGVSLLPSGNARPDMLGQMQVQLQPGQQLLGAGMGGSLSQQASAQSPFAVLTSTPAQQPSTNQQLSISSLGPVGGEFGPACWPALQSADRSMQQQLQPAAVQLQPQLHLPTLEESSGSVDEDDTQVAALDGMINQCLARLLQLRNQITARRAAAGQVGSSCSTPTANTAGPLAAAQAVLSSAAGATSDSVLLGMPRAPLHAQQLQQQHSGMVSPVSSMAGQMAPQQQQQQVSQQVFSDGRVLWVQQQPPAAPAAAGSSAVLSAPGLALQTQLGAVCQQLPQGSTCNVAGAYAGQSMPVLMPQQAQLPVLNQQQVLMQPAGLQLTPSLSGAGDGRGSQSGYFSPPTGAAGQQVLLSPRAVSLQGQMPQPAGQGMRQFAQLQQQALPQGSNLQQQTQPVQAQDIQQQLQELQQLLAQQELQGFSLN